MCYSDADQPRTTTDQPTDRTDLLIAELQDRIRSLEEANRENRRIIAALTQRIPEIEAPREPSGAREPRDPLSEPPASPTAATEQPGRAEPQPPLEGAQEPPDRPRQPDKWWSPVEKLSRWHYVLGVSLVFVATYLGLVVTPRLLRNLGGISVNNILITASIVFALAWVVPGVFGYWVGFRRRYPRLGAHVIPFGALVGVVAVSAFLFYFYGYPGPLRGESFFTDFEDNWALAFFFLPVWFLYVSGVLIGNAWQRHRTGRISGTTPASRVSGTTQTAVQSRPQGWTPRQQAIVGLAGTIISALIGLIGTILTVMANS